MPLLKFWEVEPESVDLMPIEQIVAFAGNGKLTDGSECSRELRTYLRGISTEKITDYVEQCLKGEFKKSGIVLQDLVNELGRRLNFDVENGLYSGRKNKIGFDGIWSSSDGMQIIVEVKTTDAYRLSLETIVTYQKQLRTISRVDEHSSILIVVGRQDTGELEAQVRGSRYAWDIRIISVASLLKLVEIKESTEEDTTLTKIRSILKPVEYTRVDGLIDIIFSTAKDVESSIEIESNPEDNEETKQFSVTPTEVIQGKRRQIIDAFQKKFSTKLLKNSRASYRDASQKYGVVCSISKRYGSNRRSEQYWYAYHPKWDDFLGNCEKGFFILGCVDKDKAFALPTSTIRSVLQYLNKTIRKDGVMYWHVKLLESNKGSHYMVLPNKKSNLLLDEFVLSLE